MLAIGEALPVCCSSCWIVRIFPSELIRESRPAVSDWPLAAEMGEIPRLFMSAAPAAGRLRGETTLTCER